MINMNQSALEPVVKRELTSEELEAVSGSGGIFYVIGAAIAIVEAIVDVLIPTDGRRSDNDNSRK